MSDYFSLSPENYLAYHLFTHKLVELGYDAGAREHEVIAQGGRRDFHCYHPVFHIPLGCHAVYTGPNYL